MRGLPIARDEEVEDAPVPRRPAASSQVEVGATSDEEDDESSKNTLILAAIAAGVIGYFTLFSGSRDDEDEEEREDDEYEDNERGRDDASHDHDTRGRVGGVVLDAPDSEPRASSCACHFTQQDATATRLIRTPKRSYPEPVTEKEPPPWPFAGMRPIRNHRRVV